jgi:hypothetical protein
MFNRFLNLNVNGIPIQNLRIDFDINQADRKRTKEPNNGVIKVYNLSPATRKLISVANSSVTLNAGHVDSVPAPIFFGILRDYTEENTSKDVISILEVEDRGGVFGQNDIDTLKLSLSYPPGSTATGIIAGIAGFSATPLANVPLGDYIFLDGWSFTGLLRKALDQIVYDILDLTYDIQNGFLYINDPILPTIGIPTVVTALNGLIGSPQKFTEIETQGKQALIKKSVEKIKFTTILNPRSVVGQQITLTSTVEKIAGVFKIESLRKYGSNWTNDFYNEYIVRSFI